MTTDDMIEAEVRIYLSLIAAPAAEPSAVDRHRYREALRSLVRLARSEYMESLSRDMLDAQAGRLH